MLHALRVVQGMEGRQVSDVSDLKVEFVLMMRENKELRELVRDMWFWHYEGHIDSECPEKQMEHIDGVLARMRKLGVSE